jgi:hypothetical protein
MRKGMVGFQLAHDQEHFDSGATEVHIHSGQPDQRRVIDFYGAEVRSRLGRSPWSEGV